MNTATPLPLHPFHQSLGAIFAFVNEAEAVGDYGDVRGEHTALRAAAGILDFSFRSRICLTGTERMRFLHGQVTNDVKKLRVGEGCYSALTTAKGKMQSDLNIFCLQDELLLDFEPGLTGIVTQRLEKYIVADDVQVVDVTPHYGLLSVQGPKSEVVVRAAGLFGEPPTKPLSFTKIADATLGEMYLMNHERLSGSAGVSSASSGIGDIETRQQDAGAPGSGFDLFVPLAALGTVAEKLVAAAKSAGGRACGWSAFEIARIEAGIPRFGVDMDETNLASECGIEARAISYQKGCYIGQEVLNRIHSMGHVNRELRGLRLAAGRKELPTRGDKLFHGDQEVGHITSAVVSPQLHCGIALGYVRREFKGVGTELALRSGVTENVARIVELPFAPE